MFDFDRLERIAREHHFSKADLCRMYGRERGWLKDMERQGRVPPQDAVEKWALVMNVRPEYITGETNDPSPSLLLPTAAERELLSIVRSMNEDGVRAVIAAARGMAGLPEYAGERDNNSAVGAAG